MGGSAMMDATAATEQVGSYDPFDNLPQELKGWPQWVLYKLKPSKNGKLEKIPYNVRTRGLASSTKVVTWATFDQAIAAYQKGGFAGIGFVFGKQDPFVGVDLDGCRDPETGRLEPWAGEIVERLDSYTEASPSGTGVHILVKAVLPAGGRKKDKIEMYSEGRFFTMTGEHIGGTPTTVEDRTTELAALHSEVFGKQQDYSQKQAHVGNEASNGH